MHFADTPSITKEFLEKMEKINIKSVELKQAPQEILFSKNEN